jgi:hypothetical protein
MVAAMTSSDRGALGVVVDHVASVGAGRRAGRASRRWAQTEPALAGFSSPAEVAAACRSARGAEQDRLLAGLLRVGPGDEWAPLTVLAGLSGRLGWVVAGWARAGMAAVDLFDAEAELVACCWAAISSWEGPPPGCPGLALVDRAWQEVRVVRRRQRRRDSRLCPLPPDVPAVAAVERSTLEVLAGQVTDAVVGDRLALRPAQAVYLTRVAGLSTVDAGALLGCSPGVVRVIRARAERRLAA